MCRTEVLVDSPKKLRFFGSSTKTSVLSTKNQNHHSALQNLKDLLCQTEEKTFKTPLAQPIYFPGTSNVVLCLFLSKNVSFLASPLVDHQIFDLRSDQDHGGKCDLRSNQIVI